MFLHYCVSVKHIMLCNNPCSSPSRFSVSRVVDFRIVNRYCWLWKFLNMANQGRKFSIFRGNHEKIDIRIGISLFHKAYDHQIWQSSTSIRTDSNKTNQTRGWWRKIRWQTKNIIFPLPEGLWPPNLAER